MSAAVMAFSSASVTAMVLFTGIFLAVMAAMMFFTLFFVMTAMMFLTFFSVITAVVLFLLVAGERIIVLRAFHPRGRETVSEFYAPHSGNGENSV